MFESYAVWILLLLNVGAYLAQKMTGDYGGFTQTYWLEPAQVVHQGRVWQLVTHLFLHDPRDLTHLLFNMLALGLFGPAVEYKLGSAQFLFYYLLTGVGAAGVTIAIHYGRDRSLQDAPPSVGASGAIYGLLVAYAVMLPEASIYFLFFPFPIPARLAVLVMGAMAFLAEVYRARASRTGRFTATGDRVNHLAHLGGLLFGLVYMSFRSLLGY
jgi:membrane associated rhomboid family serine protease